MKNRMMLRRFVLLVFVACGLLATNTSVGQEEPTIIPGTLKKLARVTGKSEPDELLPNPNYTDVRYDVGGTDLGIMWRMDGDKVGIWFGDTYGKSFSPQPQGGPSNSDNWRSNVLAFSIDSNLDDGLSLQGMVTDMDWGAKELLFGAKDTSGNGDWTSIPTAAIRADGVDYVHFMNIRKWLLPGSWATNYSAVYASRDHGRNWYPTDIKYNPESMFSQVAYAAHNDYVYIVGTKSGRFGAAYLARVRKKEFEKRSAYEYWNKDKGWVRNEEEAVTPIVDDTVGELSLMYHRKLKKWIMTYMDGANNRLVLRSAKRITGPWGKAEVLAKGSEYPGLYGAFLHPVKDDAHTLYFLMSEWKPYNVFLMKVDIR